MPEGDALYRFAGRVGDALEGKVILAARAHGPGPVPQVERLVGARCERVASRGKNLLIEFDNGLALRGHLRMYGTWHVYRPGERWSRPEAEARLVLEVADAVVVNFSAPVIELLEVRALARHAPVAELGPDLLADDFDANEALRRLRDPLRAEMTIGDAIMDQRVMAGVGNIWKHETLFRCGVYPWTRVRDLDDATLLELIETAQHLLRASVGKPNRWGLARRPSMYAYMRGGQPCRRCGTTLRSARQGVDIRFTAWCPRCQPAPAPDERDSRLAGARRPPPGGRPG
ncbi:MAG: putative endonuclease 8 2 [Tepidiforma sp.]|nr:DNA-formamidopyrimidine glycosylase family protein [Tepidiforma sp.]GIW17262.1 MAG: putative endonuclease 8 2 [Tepidiforma sp.]